MSTQKLHQNFTAEMHAYINNFHVTRIRSITRVADETGVTGGHILVEGANGSVIKLEHGP